MKFDVMNSNDLPKSMDLPDEGGGRIFGVSVRSPALRGCRPTAVTAARGHAAGSGRGENHAGGLRSRSFSASLRVKRTSVRFTFFLGHEPKYVAGAKPSLTNDFCLLEASSALGAIN